MRLERRSVFGWPATEAGWAPCKNGLVVHYDGSNQSLANKQHSSCRTYWKNTRRFHMNERDWLDIGYSFAVCPHAIVLEGRGWQRQQAAQPGGNSSWTSCTFMSGPSERPTSAQVKAFRELRAWLRGKGLAAAVSYHGRFISTSCPGSILRGMVTSGSLIIGSTPKPPSQEDDVSWNDTIPKSASFPEEWEAGTHQRYQSVLAREARASLARIEAKLAGIEGADVDEDAIVRGLLAGMPAEKIAALVVDEMGSEVARQVLDGMGARLAQPGVTQG